MQIKRSMLYFVIMIVTLIFFGILAMKIISQPYYPPINIPKPPQGNPDSQIVLTEWSDFECPACKNFHPVLKEVMAEYVDEVRLDFRHYPLTTIHKHALQAAEASECANDQGKFWEFIDNLFLSSELGMDSYERIGKDLYLDMKRLSDCIKSRAKMDIVLVDQREAQRLKLYGTPTLMINGEVIKNPTAEIIKERIESEILKEDG